MEQLEAPNASRNGIDSRATLEDLVLRDIFIPRGAGDTALCEPVARTSNVLRYNGYAALLRFAR